VLIFDDFLNVLDEMLRNVDAGAGSRLFLVVTPEMGKGIATAALANGITSINWNGGNLGGVELRVSDAQSANRLSLIDATGLVNTRRGRPLQPSRLCHFGRQTVWHSAASVRSL
jgi:hypothetical protein